MAAQSEQVSDRAMNREKSLGLTGGFEPTHLSFALASKFVGYLSPVVFVLFGAMYNRRHHLPVRGRIALQFVGYHSSWRCALDTWVREALGEPEAV